MKGPDFDMTGRAALLTGSGRGIGRAMAHALASAGCAVAIQDIDLAVAQQAAREITEAGGKAFALSGDIGDIPAVQKLVGQAAGQMGGLHVLINNAATQAYYSDFTQVPVDDIQREFRGNVIAPFVLCQEAAKIFRPQKWGRILNVGSIQQRAGNTHMLPYSMSKAALQLMTKGLATALVKDGITVNLVAPGYFNTWRNRGEMTDPQVKAQRGSQYVPAGYVGEPEECGGVTLLLCSAAGRYITGQTIYVDGGMSAR